MFLLMASKELNSEEIGVFAIIKKEPAPGAEIIDSAPVPKIGSTDVLVETKMASLCGTDLHIWKFSPWAQERLKIFPLILGHEFTGKVVEVGENVYSLKEGDMVSAETHIADLNCYQCHIGRIHVCKNLEILGVDRDGVFGEYVALPEINAWKNDPNLPLEIASIQEPLGNAVHTALPRGTSNDISGKIIAVLGCGPIGLMSIAVAKALGAAEIIATEGHKTRMDLAMRMGADIVLDIREEGDNLVKTVLDATDGNGVDVVFEMSGAPSALLQGLQMLTPGGRISLLGLYNRPIEVDLTNLVVFKAITVYGITGRLVHDTWYQVKGLLKRHEFRKKISHVITHSLSFGEFEKGLKLLSNKEAAKITLEPTWN